MDGSFQRVAGVMIGRLVSLQDGNPLVSVGGDALPARSLTPLDALLVGAEIAVMFEEGDPARPLVIGPLLEPPSPEVLSDGQRVRITAAERIELRVGKASIILDKSGRITIRGSYLTSHASATNRAMGGSVQLN